MFLIQTHPYYVGYFVIAVVCGLIFWVLLTNQEWKGKNLQHQMSKGEISEPLGHGAWYARNITRSVTRMLYTIGHMVLTALIIILVLLVLVPTDYQYTLNTTSYALPLFFLIGICVGIPGPEANKHLQNSANPAEE